jgi:uncharacterized protein
MIHGLEDEELADITRVFFNFPAIDEVILFGSRALGKEKTGSDIDLAIKGKGLTFDDIINVELALEKLNLLLKFDIVNYQAITDKELVEHINRAGQIIFTRGF